MPEILPWEFVRQHDHTETRDPILTLYSALQLPAPRIAWAASPRSLFLATRMLRDVQAGMAYNMVQALVPQSMTPAERIDREARVALLTAMIDPNVTTQSGGLLINMLSQIFGSEDHYYPIAVHEMRNLMRFHADDPQSGNRAPGFYEQALWPSMYPGLNLPRLKPLARHALVLMPFTKICWLCPPPKYIHRDEFGHLHCTTGPAAEWADGFCVYADRTPDEQGQLAEPRMGIAGELPEPARAQLTSGVE